MSVPTEAPPPYSRVDLTGTGAPPGAPPSASHSSQRLQVPEARNGIPPADRRSMEDEARPIPDGWVRQYDTKHHHQFYVDTRAHPPRSIWSHPYDDDQYLSTLPTAERERIQELTRHPSHHDLVSGLSSDEDDDDSHHSARKPGAAGSAELPERPTGQDSSKRTFGRKLKDKLTSTTHEQREDERRKREEEERKAYEQHMVVRQAMRKAMETGQPQLIGKDRQGKDVFIQPPEYGGAYPGIGGYGVNPYAGNPYSSPNSRYVRPGDPYRRPYGYGYGGGYGLPLAGGLAGGMLLGGMMGGFGGGGL